MTHDSFINDIQPLIRAFFPGEDIQCSYAASAPGDSFSLSLDNDGEPVSDFEIKDETVSQRLQMKNVLKCTLYRDLSSALKKELPWGTLTGIRPVRLAMNRLDTGRSPEEVRLWMQEYYLVSPEKAGLSVDIALRELNVINRVNKPDSFSLYIGIPFCPSTCLYCSFPSNAISKWRNRVKDYLICLDKEMAAVEKTFSGKSLLTLYIGGGTPTTLEEEELKILFDMVSSHFDLKYLREFTVEAGRPDSITPGKLKVMKEYGVDRLSVNPQTMNDETLKIIGRRHTAGDTVRAFNEARSEGFGNINMDLILGLPGEGEREVKNTLSGIKDLMPDDLTVHSLALKKGSRLKEKIDEYGLQSLDNTEFMMDIASSGAKEMGLSPYYLYRQKNMSGNFENTGWCREGKEGLYNILMMEEVHSIPALGAGTVSKYVSPDGKTIRRFGSPKDLNQYFDRIDNDIERKIKIFTE